jgi:hypothetical protein
VDLFLPAVMHFPDSQRSQEGGMTGKYPEIPLASGDIGLLDFGVDH